MNRPAGAGKRKTTQRLMPGEASARRSEGYEVFPEFPVPEGSVGVGFEALADALAGAGEVALDGVPAVDWEGLVAGLELRFAARGLAVAWRDARAALRPESELDALIAPYLGGDDPLFGTRCGLELGAFFRPDIGARVDAGSRLVVHFGPGAALLAGAGAVRAFVDLPKNEEQFRARAGAGRNLGAVRSGAPKSMYKRAYFVDWPVLKRHKAALVGALDWYVDGQDPARPTFLAGAALRAGLERLARSPFRPRPWFEPGPWGGRWLEPRVREACASEPPNIAWSFELIAPENGVVLADGRWRCEVSLEWLLAFRGAEVQGFGHAFFGDEFPIRFDFLDTIDGGNLSLQVHPGPDCIRREFGERFTQDETYYMLDCTPEATVYLGLREETDLGEFRAALEDSAAAGREVDVERFVQRLPAKKHDLFLIPHGTVHCSGRGAMVLEISATPYIFTFKMYDWLRLDLEGRPRPLNLERAFCNLDGSRRGDLGQRELVSAPRLVAEGAGWRREELPTHRDHFYAIDRYRLDPGGCVDLPTGHSPWVLMVVEGAAVEVTAAGEPARAGGRFAYAETVVVPAAAGTFRLENPSAEPVLVVAARIEPVEHWPAWMQEAPDARR